MVDPQLDGVNVARASDAQGLNVGLTPHLSSAPATSWTSLTGGSRCRLAAGSTVRPRRSAAGCGEAELDTREEKLPQLTQCLLLGGPRPRLLFGYSFPPRHVPRDRRQDRDGVALLRVHGRREGVSFNPNALEPG